MWETTSPPRQVSGSTLGGQPLTGNVYYGPDLFSAYLLSDGTNPVYAITGTPTGDTGVFEGSDVRRYSVSTGVDGVPVPFFRDGIVTLTGGASPDFAGTDLYVVESPSGQPAQMLQVWLQIDNGGEGGQQSAIGITLGGGDGSGLSATRSGSYRDGSGGEIVSLFGTVGTVAGPTGAEIFGTNAQNFVLGADVDSAGVFNDSSASGGTNEDFNSLHVANLEETTAAGSQDLGLLTGFAAGMLESPEEGPPSLSALRSNGLGVSAQFDAAANTLGVDLTLHDSAGTPALTASIGGDAATSVYVNDDLFAAVQTTPDSIYFVSADAIPDYDFMPAGSSICAACASWSEWGWWGGALDDGSVHLGTWVAANAISTWGAVSGQFPSTSLTFEGQTVASVALSGDQAIAGGTSRVTWNDDLGIGFVTLTDLGGQTYGGVLTSSGGGAGDSALLTSTLYGYQQLAPLGSADVAFASNGADALAGVLGDFGMESSGYKASGTLLAAYSATADEATAPIPFRILTNDPVNSGVPGGGEYADQSRMLTLGFDPALTLKVTGNVDDGVTARRTSRFRPLLTTRTLIMRRIGLGSSFGGNELSGTVYYGPGLFSAYLLTYSDELGELPFYAITGTHTDIQATSGT